MSFDPSKIVYYRFGKKYRKIGRDEVIEEGAMHSLCGYELKPLASPDTVGQTPSAYSDEREFYNPIKE